MKKNIIFVFISFLSVVFLYGADKVYTLNTDGIKKFKIETIYSDLVYNSSDYENFVINYVSLENEYPDFSYKKDFNLFSVKESFKKTGTLSFLKNFIVRENQEYIEWNGTGTYTVNSSPNAEDLVYITKNGNFKGENINFTGQFNIFSENGDVSAENIKSNKILLNVDRGKVDFKSIKTNTETIVEKDKGDFYVINYIEAGKKLSVKIKEGSAVLYNLSADNIYIEIESGNVIVSAINFVNLEIRLKKGNINLSLNSENTHIKADASQKIFMFDDEYVNSADIGDGYKNVKLITQKGFINVEEYRANPYSKAEIN